MRGLSGLARQHQLGAVGLHGLCPFDRQILGHDQDHAVAEHRRGHGQGDAGVARGGLDQRVAGADVAALGGAADHAQRRPVLDRTGRVVALELAEDDIAAGVVVGAGQALQPHQWRGTDRVLQGLVVRRFLGGHGRAYGGRGYCGSAPPGPPKLHAIIRDLTCLWTHPTAARVAKSVDAGDSKSPAARRAGSSPAPGTRQHLQLVGACSR